MWDSISIVVRLKIVFVSLGCLESSFRDMLWNYLLWLMLCWVYNMFDNILFYFLIFLFCFCVVLFVLNFRLRVFFFARFFVFVKSSRRKIFVKCFYCCIFCLLDLVMCLNVKWLCVILCLCFLLLCLWVWFWDLIRRRASSTLAASSFFIVVFLCENLCLMFCNFLWVCVCVC